MANVHEKLARQAKATAILACLRRAAAPLELNAHMLESISDLDWTRATLCAGQKLPSQATKDLCREMIESEQKLRRACERVCVGSRWVHAQSL
jgi:hypothetical protein